ncbi:MAG TPA: GNAT family N-acetyltransferase [Acidimicrobiales bacterium]|nr:GNAT family N-acetyltransferase [Acidimicrobiales bacterium]
MAIIDQVLDGLDDSELAARIRFLLEIDRLKTINRRTRISDSSRFENSAEHSWHLAMMALVLAPHASAAIDVGRVVQLLLVHDIVEIDADDVFLYDTKGRETKAASERAAAARIYGLLPRPDGTELRDLWEEFEERVTPESRFAAAVDRLQPLLLNLVSNGRTWNEHGIEADRVYQANRHIESGSVDLWDLARTALDLAVSEGILGTGPTEPLAVVNELVIRPTTLQDLDRVLEIERMPEHADAIGSWARIRHQERIGSETALHLVFERHGVVLGYAVLSSIDTPVVSLDHFTVADKRRGHGSTALSAILDHLFSSGARKCWLDVVGHNSAAISFYESLGFVREGLLAMQDNLNGRVVDLVLMGNYGGDERSV